MRNIRTELYWIEGSWPGRLAIMPRPRGGDWLEDEISSWQRLGIDTIVSALTKEENAELDLAQEKEQCEKAGIEFLVFPIADRGVPDSARDTWELVRRLEQKVTQGEKKCNPLSAGSRQCGLAGRLCSVRKWNRSGLGLGANRGCARMHSSGYQRTEGMGCAVRP